MKNVSRLITHLHIPSKFGAAFSRLRCIALVASLGLSIAGAHAQSPASHNQGPAASVDPMIGTGADPDDGINLFPGASMPFGMVQLSPDTEDHGLGYHYIHSKIKGFSMTPISAIICYSMNTSIATTVAASAPHTRPVGRP